MYKRACILLLVFLLLSCFVACSNGNKINQTYSVKSEKLQEINLPTNLPSEVSDWSRWDRKSEWLKIDKVSDGTAQLFANNKENDKLYLLLNGKFYILNWTSVRKDEEDVKFYEYDIDDDGKNELIAISPISGGTNWYREKLYIIESDGKVVTSTEFPLSEFENWIKNNLSLDLYKLKFINLTLNFPEKNNGNLADELTSVSFSFENGFKMNIEIAVVADSLTPIAEIICEIKYNSGEFSVENASLIPV